METGPETLQLFASLISVTRVLSSAQPKRK
jgi:hypothetical protein